MNYSLPHIPARTKKPRESGLTMVMDKGMSMRQAEDMIQACGHLVDIVKIGFGTSYVTPNLKEKIALYHKADMRVYLGGTLFEAFIARGMFEAYRKLVDDLGLECAEVSDGSINIPHVDKCKYINTLARDLTVLSEVGSKESGILISPAKWVRMMLLELDAGSWKVIAEARESGTVGIYRPSGHAHTTLVNRIVASATSFFEEVQGDPEHPFRGEFNRMLLSLVDRLGSDPAFAKRIDGLKRDILARPELGDLARNVWSNARSFVERSASGETQVLQQHLAKMFVEAGEALAADAEMRAEINQGLVAVLRAFIADQKSGVSTFIADQVKAWDMAQLISLIEINVGKDLQYIRFNGSLIGGLAGLALYTLEYVLRLV